jgi:hypothetical protein
MTLEEFYELPTIMSYFPLTFVSGRQKWTNFEISCNECKKPIPQDKTRGEVAKLFGEGYRSVKVDYEVVAHGLCPYCDKLTTARYTLHEDMTLTGHHPKTREMSRWGMRKLTWWEKLLEWFSHLKRTAADP